MTLVFGDDINYVEISPQHFRFRKSFAATKQLDLRKYDEGKYSGYFFYEDLELKFVRVSTFDCRVSPDLMKSFVKILSTFWIHKN